MDKQSKKDLIKSYKERKLIGGVYAIKNNVTGKMLLQSALDLQGSKNRFAFAKQTGSCVSARLQEDWKKYGADAFSFELLEELEKKETQTDKEFSDDIKVLEEIWLEKCRSNGLY